jgi:glycosyltransferase involved in cell wall biosynthesis
MSDRPTPTLSVVVPCYNEEEVLPQTAAQLQDLIEDMVREGRIGPDSHAIFVDDGSRDRTWTLIEELHRRSARVRGLKLSRNRGHQNALLAGLLSATGDIVVSVDADLQDDLAVMGDMVDAYVGGADVVLGTRRDRNSDTAFKRMTAQAYYRFLRWMGVEIVYNHADYRLLSRRAVEALREYGEANLFLRALVVQLGFRTAIVAYDRRTRAAGQSKYPLRQMLSLGLGGITAFSTMPLRYITVLGFLISLFAFLLGGWALLAAFSGRAVPGWTSTVVPIYLICGVQLTCLGIIGEYIGRIYHETKRRPRYIVETALLGEAAASGAPDLGAREGPPNRAVPR